VAATCGALVITFLLVQKGLEISYGIALWRAHKPLP